MVQEPAKEDKCQLTGAAESQPDNVEAKDKPEVSSEVYITCGPIIKVFATFFCTSD